jgi:hypothetical protein
MYTPPFCKDIFGEVFDFEVELALCAVNLLYSGRDVNGISEAVALARRAINIEDYEPKSKKQEVFISLTQREARIFYTFELKCEHF